MHKHHLSILLLFVVACKSTPTAQPRISGAPPPNWVSGLKIAPGLICGTGTAGRGFDAWSPYPKQLSEERAVRNLAGILGTTVQEAIIDKETEHNTQIRYARTMHVDQRLIDKVAEAVETDFWIDKDGTGPYGAKDFTYARSCMKPSQVAAAFQIDPRKLAQIPAENSSPRTIPSWINHHGKRPDGRLCAVGYSLPTFHPDKAFTRVVEVIRSQLATVVQTFVSSYYEELSTDRTATYEAMTLATVDAISTGAIVTHYWYDRDGIGPNQRSRTTYGWGCVYPLDILQQRSEQVAKSRPPEESDVIAKVRQRAAAAFDNLDAEIDKRSARTPPTDVAPGQTSMAPDAISSNDDVAIDADAAVLPPTQSPSTPRSKIAVPTAP
ncbi:MAG: hypothetical protein R3C68_14305 [Myxococcota bacterium]